MKIWSQFAKTGSPNLPNITNGLEWGQFSDTTEAMLLKGYSEYEIDPKWRVQAARYWTEYLFVQYPA